MATSQELTNSITEHQLDLTKYANKEARTVKPFIKYIEDYLKKRIYDEGDTIVSQKKLKELQKDVKSYLDGQYTEWFDDYFEPMLNPLAEEEIEFTDMAVNNVVSGYSSIQPSGEQVLAAAYKNPLILNNSEVDFGAYTKNWKPNEIKRVAARISAGFYSGETTQSIVQGLVGKSTDRMTEGTRKGSVMNMSRSNIYGMVKTSINHMSSEARKEFGNKNTDLIIGSRFISTLDTNTSNQCRYYDQTVFLYKDYPNGKYPTPPLHINCRSTLSYEMSSDYDFLKEGKTRPAVSETTDGKSYAENVPARQSYYSWLKNQPAAVQTKALGKEKGLIFRNSGLSPQEFKQATTNQFGQELSLDEMRRNNAKIDEYMKRQDAE